MKYIFFFVSLFTFSCTQSVKKESGVVHADSSVTTIDTTAVVIDTIIKKESKVEQIRALVQNINQQKLLVQTFNWKQSSCADVGTASYYLNGDEIVKVVETGFIGDGGWTKEYYYHQGKFIFSFEQYIGGPASMPLDTFETRIYVNADTLVLQRKNSDNLPLTSKRLTERSREYRVLKALKTKQFGEAFCN